MDFRHLARRVRGLLLAPRSEWRAIAAETTTAGKLFRGYVLWLAAIPAICGFIRGSLLGYSSSAFTIARIGFANGISRMILGYLMGLAIVFLMGLIVDGLAPNFGGHRNPVQAFKAVVYAFTAVWVSSLGELLPVVSPLVMTAGAGYSIWLLFVGLQHTMQAPRSRAPAYTAIVVLATVLITLSFLILRAGIVAVSLRLA